MSFMIQMHKKQLVGRVTPCAPLPGLSNVGAHGVTRPTVKLS